MGLPDKAIKHIARHQLPVGSKNKGRLKVKDGDTGKVSWRSGKKGFVKDYDEDPTSVVYANQDMKISHKVRGGNQRAQAHVQPKGAQLPDLPEE